jgi:hypothetical protein
MADHEEQNEYVQSFNDAVQDGTSSNTGGGNDSYSNSSGGGDWYDSQTEPPEAEE